MLRKFFFTLFLSIGVCVTPLYGSDCETCCSDCLGSGFLIGGYAAFHSFYFHAKDDVHNEDERLFWEYNATQVAPGGGGFIGYGVSFCDRFSLACKVAATGFASEAQHSYYDDNPLNSYTNRMRVKYMVDLSLEPGALIGNCLLLYFKIGASTVGLNQTRQIVDVDIPDGIFGTDKQHYHSWGYLCGAGANVLITRCISAFAEYDWHAYSINNSKKRVDNSGDPDDPLEYRLTRVNGYGFRFGLIAQF